LLDNYFYVQSVVVPKKKKKKKVTPHRLTVSLPAQEIETQVNERLRVTRGTWSLACVVGTWLRCFLVQVTPRFPPQRCKGAFKIMFYLCRNHGCCSASRFCGRLRQARAVMFFFSLENNSYFSVLKDITVFNYF